MSDEGPSGARGLLCFGVTIIATVVVVPGLLFLLSWAVAALFDVVDHTHEAIQHAAIAGAFFAVVGAMKVGRDEHRRRGRNDPTRD